MKSFSKNSLIFISIFFLSTCFIFSQNPANTGSFNFQKMRWSHVATQMPESWYHSDEAKQVAENVLFAQKESGGWEKNKPYHRPLSDEDKAYYAANKSKYGATIDNGATSTEMLFLAKIYSHTHIEKYKSAFLKALDYLLEAQYENGGWPQFYPYRDGNKIGYSSHITYNDDAMVNVMKILRDISYQHPRFQALELEESYIQKAEKAVIKGTDCILKTQIKVNTVPTVWCAQHDEFTLAPAGARSYELASFSGAESTGVVLFLMSLKNPSAEIIQSVDGAVQWFKDHQLNGIKVERKREDGFKFNTTVVEDADAPPIWGRFYDLDTEKPFFCDRDGIKKNSLDEIGEERRNGYSWYTNAPAKVIEEYPNWKASLHR